MAADDNNPSLDFLTKEVVDLKKQIEKIQESLGEDKDPAEVLEKIEKEEKK